jgi:hypothetical protein
VAGVPAWQGEYACAFVMNKGAKRIEAMMVRTVIVPLDLMIILPWSQGKFESLSLERLEPGGGK